MKITFYVYIKPAAPHHISEFYVSLNRLTRQEEFERDYIFHKTCIHEVPQATDVINSVDGIDVILTKDDIYLPYFAAKTNRIFLLPVDKNYNKLSDIAAHGIFL